MKKIFCDCCGKQISSDEKMYKIKKRFLFPDGAEIWSAMGNVYLCEGCISKVKKIINKKES